MKESLHRNLPPSASRIDAELWVRNLRWRWFRRACRSVLARLVRPVAEARVAWRAGVLSRKKASDEGIGLPEGSTAPFIKDGTLPGVKGDTTGYRLAS
jgi:hypothetical protein